MAGIGAVEVDCRRQRDADQHADETVPYRAHDDDGMLCMPYQLLSLALFRPTTIQGQPHHVPELAQGHVALL